MGWGAFKITWLDRATAVLDRVVDAVLWLQCAIGEHDWTPGPRYGIETCRDCGVSRAVD